jgi:hypothetical protein
MPRTLTRSLTRRRPAHLAWFVKFLNLSFILVLFLYFLLPGHLLLLMGWNYLGGGGAEIEKIHIATYLLTLVFGLMLIVDTRFRHAAIVISGDLSFIAFVISVAATALFAVLASHVSIAPFVDTLGGAIIGTIGCVCLPTKYLGALKRLLNAYFITNIAIVFFEYYTKSDIFYPHYQELFRASGWFEAPLSAAALLGLYSLVILISTRISFSLHCITRLLLSVISLAAVLTTGGRTAAIATTVIGAGYLCISFINQIRRGYLNKAGLIYSVAAIPLVIVGLSTFAWLGLFDTIAGRFEYDIGSAMTRQLALNLVFNMSAGELLFGLSAPDVLNLVSIQAELGIIAIEISWVNFIIVCGLVFTIPLFVTYILFLFRFLPKYCGFAVLFPSVSVLVNTSASNGIWTKTTILTTSLALMISFLRKGSPNQGG